MSLNSSSVNASLSPSTPPYSFDFYNCLNSAVGVFSTTAFTIISILLLLPLCVLVLYLGYQRWRQQRSGTTTNHSDVFTYHMTIAELMSFFGTIFIFCSVHTDNPLMMEVGLYLWIFNFSGQTFFHTLTCVERYLAVVHPVTYLSLRQAKGIRLRNITTGCVWLLCFLEQAIKLASNQVLNIILIFSSLVFPVIIVSFCSISVLCILIHPGPGEEGGDRRRVDQTKLRAFYTIMVILGVLVLRLGGITVTISLRIAPHLGENEICGGWLSETWISLPSSLVLPLLFVHRAGKLSCCKNKNTSGQGSD